MVPGTTNAFWPYYRIEQGNVGNEFYLDSDVYDFKTYLDADDETGAKVIDRVTILWQTKDAIGDNSEGELVWFDKNTNKIYVRTNAPGNALVGAYNKNNKIIWSWHIWITDNDPGNVASAQVYTTYDWDSSRIYGDSYKATRPRIPGYAIMPCNLGALAFDRAAYNETGGDNIPTFGMSYQWGRKDPFPAFTTVNSVTHTTFVYSNVYTNICGNDNNTLAFRFDNADKASEDIFWALSGSYIKSHFSSTGHEALTYTIAHPSHFMCGTYSRNGAEAYCNNYSNYVMDGDWSPYYDDCLWGGYKTTDTRVTKSLKTASSYDIYIYDNYGPDKTIFDPCPRGWRVAPPDLWIGFTKTGYNPSGSYSSYAFPEINTSQWTYGGAKLHLQEFKSGPTSWFPSQGILRADASGFRVGYCGIYHNACASMYNYTANVHVHCIQNSAAAFRIFDYDYFHCVAKSTGGPVRCVRDRK